VNLPKLGDVICINTTVLTGIYGLDDLGCMDLFKGDVATVLNSTHEDKYDVIVSASGYLYCILSSSI